VLASFVERILANIEVEVKDVTVKIVRKRPVDDQQTVLTFALASLVYGSPEDNAGVASQNRAAGPTFQYHKAIRFRGFQVSLDSEELEPEDFGSLASLHSARVVRDMGSPGAALRHGNDTGGRPSGNAVTIISGEAGQESVIGLKVSIGATSAQTHAALDCFVKSLRMVIDPANLALLVDLIGAVTECSARVATAVEQRKLRQQQQQQLQEAHMQGFTGVTAALPQHFTSVQGATGTAGMSQHHATAAAPLPYGTGHSRPLNHNDWSVIADLMQQAQHEVFSYARSATLFQYSATC